MSANNNLFRAALALTFVLSACGDDNTPQTECGTGTMLVNGKCESNAECGAGTTLTNGECVSDAVCGAGTVLTAGMCLPMVTPPVTTYRQVEHLARPGVNEALLITDGYLDGYNATAPSFAGAPAAAVTAITAEAKTVLKALYLGACLLNGTTPGGITLTATTGVHPAGATCNAIGTALWSENTLAGVTLTAGTQTAATAYADRVFGQFEPDVMRIDTNLATSGYLNLCGDPTATLPLLCGGRYLTDDVIDVTYNYFLAGAAITTGSPAQFRALVGDGVNYSTTVPGAGTVSTADPTNLNQGHPAVTTAFPYSAAPF